LFLSKGLVDKNLLLLVESDYACFVHAEEYAYLQTICLLVVLLLVLSNLWSSSASFTRLKECAVILDLVHYLLQIVTESLWYIQCISMYMDILDICIHTYM
jgi:hypothetical protein